LPQRGVEGMNLQETILKTIGLGKSFKGFSAVSDVNLDVTRGTIHALIGPNGADLSKKFRELLDNEEFFQLLQGGGIQSFYNNEILSTVIPNHIDEDFLLLKQVKDLLNENKDLLKLLENKKLLNLMKDPEFLKLYDAGVIKNLLNNRDFQSLIAQKDFLNVVKDKDMLAMLNDENIQKFIQNQDFTKLLQEAGVLEMLQDQKNVEVLSQILKDSQLEGFLKMHEAQKPNTDLIVGMGVLSIISLVIIITSLVAKQIINKSKIDKINEGIKTNKDFSKKEIEKLNSEVEKLSRENDELAANVDLLNEQLSQLNTYVENSNAYVENSNAYVENSNTLINGLSERMKEFDKKYTLNQNDQKLLHNLSKNLENLENTLIDKKISFDSGKNLNHANVNLSSKINSIKHALSVVETIYYQKNLIDKENIISADSIGFEYKITNKDKDITSLLKNITGEFANKYIEKSLKEGGNLTNDHKKIIGNAISNKEIDQEKFGEEGLNYIKSFVRDIINNIKSSENFKDKIDNTKKITLDSIEFKYESKDRNINDQSVTKR